jgi:hypothetical protein
MTDMREETMVERVARAIHAAFNDSGAADYTYAWDDPLAGRDHFRLLARAAIEAMREPTATMIDAAYDRHGALPRSAYAYDYNLMIDAALSEPQGRG